MTESVALGRLESALQSQTRAELRFDAGHRGLYATDASLYQIMPAGVVIPRSASELPVIVRLAAEHGVSIVPRGGATSLTGQTVGPGLILDCSKYLQRIGIVDRDRMTVDVEPGVVLDRLNAQLTPLGLMFAPDVSTSDRATIGGMIGNNSAGARSLRYGKTVDHVASLDVVLDDGTPLKLEGLDDTAFANLCAGTGRAAELHRTVSRIVGEHESEIRARFPRILRRVSGYNLDELVPGLAVRPLGWPAEPWQFNLARLIVGSEGTLAVVRGARLRLVKRPAFQGLVVLSFSSIPAALERLQDILETGPISVEMLDRTILDLAAAQPGMASALDFTAGRPEAVLAAQFYAETESELRDRTEDLAARFEGHPGVLGVRKRGADAARDSFWKVRKAGLSLLMGLVGDAKPVAFVEDTAVAPERLPAFYERFLQIVERHGARAACYGHADVGCLHIRPILDVKTDHGRRQLEGIAAEVAGLVAEFEGAMSGEHGDGLARSRWNRPLFGESVYQAFQQVKAAFDPHNRLNPGKVVAEPALTDHLRLGPAYHSIDPESTALDFSAQGGFSRAIEMCSGVGACRKVGTGTMCPSYMVTLDEEHSTRGRANLLRLAISGQLPDGLADASLHEALDLCLGCKACKTECPSNVDMANLKAETLHQLHLSQGVPLTDLAFGHVYRWLPLASAVAPLANAASRVRPLRWLMEKATGIDRRRGLPVFAPTSFRRWFRKHTPAGGAGRLGEVILLDDCFTNVNAPAAGQAAVRVLEAAGYRVRLAGLDCCGRPAISKGLLDVARSLAGANVRALAPHAARGVPILGIEPSCITTFVDEYHDFRLGEDARVVASACGLVDDFVADPARVPDLPLRPLDRQILVHGHCQQKAVLGTAGTEAALRRIPGAQVQMLDSGCCGMAGSFGYEVSHREVSEALANRVLLPALRNNPDALLAAPGFSCRSQVHDLAGARAQHPIEIIAGQLS